VFSSMRLGFPFIAPRQLGAVESIPGRQFLPSVAWRTGQSGAPPDTVWCRFLGHVSRADRAADRWPGRQSGAHRTVRCTPDSPVNYSRTPLITSREQLVRLSQPGAPDTVRCTTGHFPVWISFLLWRSRPLALWRCWRTGHYPVHTGQSGAPFRPLARPRVSRGSRGRPLAHRIVRCTPDSPVHTRQSGEL
jgi:hypothetical protein